MAARALAVPFIAVTNPQVACTWSSLARVAPVHQSVAVEGALETPVESRFVTCHACWTRWACWRVSRASGRIVRAFLAERWMPTSRRVPPTHRRRFRQSCHRCRWGKGRHCPTKRWWAYGQTRHHCLQRDPWCLLS